MTTIVGVQYPNKCVIAADNQITDDQGRRLNHPDMKKISEKGNFLIAGSGEVSPCDIVQHFWSPPKPTIKDRDDLYHFMITKAMPSMRKCLTDNSYDFNEGKGEGKDNGEQRFHFLIAVGGELFDVGDDLSVCRTDDNWYAVGSGAPYALGALYMGASPEDAVKAAIKYSIYSSGPILIKEQYK